MNNAKLHSSYSKLTASISGGWRMGLRQDEQGNMVHINDTNVIAVIRQLRPISVVFTFRHFNQCGKISSSAIQHDEYPP